MKASPLESLRTSWALLSKKQRQMLVVLAVLRAMTSFLDILGLILVGLAGGVAADALDSTGIAYFDSLGTESQLILLVTLATIILGLRTFATTIISRSALMYLAKIETHFASLMVDRVFLGRLPELKSYTRAEIDWIVSRSSHTAFSGLLANGMSLVSDSLVALFLLTFLLIQNWIATVIVSAYLLLVFWLLDFVSRKSLARLGRKYSDASLSVGEHITNHISAFREIYVGRKESLFADMTKASREDAAISLARLQFVAGLPRVVVESALLIGAVIFLTVGILNFSELGGLAFFAVFLIGGMRISSSLLPVQRAFMSIVSEHHMAQAAQQAVRYCEANRASVSDPESAEAGYSGPQTDLTQAVGPPQIRASGLAFTHRDSTVEVLNDVNFIIPPASITAFVGPSGGGKSTLVDIVLGLQRVPEGTIEINGFSPLIYRNLEGTRIAYVPQRPGLIAGTIRENIVLDYRDTSEPNDRLTQCIKIAELSEWIEILPDGIDSQVGPQVDSLSGGQIQRIGLARALYSNPTLLILDEATSALDAETEARATKNLWQLSENMTIIVVAHRLSTIVDADQIVLLFDGTVQSAGTFETLKATSPKFRIYLEKLGITGGSGAGLGDT